MEKEITNICGTVENIVYSNEDSGFTVLDLAVEDELICVVGQMLNVQCGEELQLTGSFDTHKTYGMQFKVDMYERRLPTTQTAISKYLASGVIKGIGKVLARRIVDKFGEETFDVIENEPLRLIEVEGITASKADKIAKDFKEVFGVRALMSFLTSHGINPMQSVVVYKKWGNVALELIQQNPYIITICEANISFEHADNIASSLQLPLTSPQRIGAGVKFVLNHNLFNGHTCLPIDKLVVATSKLLQLENEIIRDTIDSMISEQELYSYEDSKHMVFLPNYYKSQQYIVKKLKSLIDNYAQFDNSEAIIYAIEKIETRDNISYEKYQREAIIGSVSHDAFILTGGPGTGKTTTLNAIIEILEQQGRSVAIVAPTGRASKRISEVTNREAKTIHRLLEVAVGYAKTGKLEFIYNDKNPLKYDVIVVDEMSMVDTLLFEALLRAMKPNCKIVMVGDYNQLPSVGAGNILRDLIASDTIPATQLMKIFRQAAKSLIVTNSHCIVNGEMPDLKIRDNDFFFMPENNQEQVSSTIVDLVSRRLPNTYGFSPIEDIQVLCPQRKGLNGTYEINKMLQQKLNPPNSTVIEMKIGEQTFRVGDKVMQIKNNYDIEWDKNGEKGSGVFNGDIGTIKMIDRASGTIELDFDGRNAFYSSDMATELELAYAITVHKSQGSEFEAIILPIIGGYDKLYFRNLLYTAVTRAKKILIIIGSSARVQFTIKNHVRTLRYTSLKTMLENSVFNDE